MLAAPCGELEGPAPGSDRHRGVRSASRRGPCVRRPAARGRRGRRLPRGSPPHPPLRVPCQGDPAGYSLHARDRGLPAPALRASPMTFSLIGRCERTGMLGIAISTSEMAVGSRCIHVAPNIGAIITQASTNPRLGHLGLNLLRAGHSATRVLDAIAASDEFVERRQLGCLDVTGLGVARTGSGNRPWAGHRVDRNVVVAANAVAGAEVADAMFDAFKRGGDLPMWERLLGSLEAGKAAGGQPDGETSSGLYVVDRDTYPMVDLRVDLHASPIAELRRLADAYFPLVAYYQLRPRDPNVPPAAEWLAGRR